MFEVPDSWTGFPEAITVVLQGFGHSLVDRAPRCAPLSVTWAPGCAPIHGPASLSIIVMFSKGLAILQRAGLLDVPQFLVWLPDRE